LLYNLPAPAQGHYVVVMDAQLSGAAAAARSRGVLLLHLPAPTQKRHDVVMDAHSILDKYTSVAPDLLRCLD